VLVLEGFVIKKSEALWNASLKGIQSKKLTFDYQARLEMV
jgi:hypothetical protein